MPADDTTKTSLAKALRIAVPWARGRFGLYWHSRRFWLSVVAAVAITAVSGPFHTITRMGLPLRLMYWTLLLVPTILFALAVSLLARETARRAGLPWALAALLAGIVLLIAVVPYSKLLLWLLGADNGMTIWYIAQVSALPTIGMTLLVNAFLPTLQPLSLIRRDALAQVPEREVVHPLAQPARAPSNIPEPTAEPGADPQTPPSPLFERLPPELGRDIVCMRADNHHIEVTTPLGRARILMRLGDAEADLNCRDGLRVHRSWWVNLAHVERLDPRPGGGFELLTSQGARIPVSRAQRDAVRAALKSRS